MKKFHAFLMLIFCFLFSGFAIAKEIENSERLNVFNTNASIKIGGEIKSQYSIRSANIDANTINTFNNGGDDYLDWIYGTYERKQDFGAGDLSMRDVKVNFDISINECFGAFIQLDLQSSGGISANGDSDIAEAAYVYWQKINDSNFGILVGRDTLKFGQGDNPGVLGTYVSGSGEGISDSGSSSNYFNAAKNIYAFGFTDSTFFDMGLILPHNGWDVKRVTQITPYWKDADEKLRLELSLFQNIGSNDTFTGTNFANYDSSDDGFRSFSGRIVSNHINGVQLSASFLNYFSRFADEQFYNFPKNLTLSKNNTAFGLAASFRPIFNEKLFVWGEWINSSNAAHFKDLNSDAINFGAAYDFTKNLTIFGQGDYLITTFKQTAANNLKTDASAIYGGIQYKLPYGVNLEAGWKHEMIEYSDDTDKNLLKANANTIYFNAGFAF